MFSEEFIQDVERRKLDVIVYTAVRNELSRLPAFLDHYREMGIKLFAIVDNGSEDGTFEYLQAQDDVFVVQSREPFTAANLGMQWLNELHQKLAGIWILYADADELLVYRGWPQKKIAEVCAIAASQHCNAIFGTMVDMYPDGPLEMAIAPHKMNLFKVAPCFDKDYRFRLTPVKPWQQPFKFIEIIGGPRLRLISSFEREVSTGWLTYLVRGQIDRVLPLTPDRFLPWLVRMWPKQPPALAKTPLMLSGSGASYTSNHWGPGSILYRESTVICHFKFLADFGERVRREASRGEHYRRGAEYIILADAVSRFGQIDLRYEGTLKFEGAEQFVNLGLIRDIRSFLDEPLETQSSPEAQKLAFRFEEKPEREVHKELLAIGRAVMKKALKIARDKRVAADPAE